MVTLASYQANLPRLALEQSRQRQSKTHWLKPRVATPVNDCRSRTLQFQNGEIQLNIVRLLSQPHTDPLRQIDSQWVSWA